jgi:transcriptional regulator with XRE-family HTH domain
VYTRPLPDGVGVRLQALRRERGLSIASLARRSGVRGSMITSIERDGVGTPEQIVRLGHALEVDPSWLIYGDERVADRP